VRYLCATVFGLPRAVFPALARAVFLGGPATLGILYAAPAAGALVGSLTSGWLGSVRRQGRIVILAIAGWTANETFRSRISAVQMAVVEGGPRLGDLESGAVATAVSTQFSIVSGGVACAIGAVAVAVLLPGFRRYVSAPVEPRAKQESTDSGL
jgi:ENTS family enterobactin (siderophore) exporter